MLKGIFQNILPRRNYLQKGPSPKYKSRYYSLYRDYETEKKLIESSKNSPFCNLPKNVSDRIGANLHLKKNHPINIIKIQIQNYFQNWGKKNGITISLFDDLSPVMSTKKAFDEILIPKEHSSRQPSDTYYLGEDLVLRPHTSAHQNEILSSGFSSFLCTGDVYRRDTIDGTHFPIFHQMEGVYVFKEDFFNGFGTVESKMEYAVGDMKAALEGMSNQLFGNVKFRWNLEYFPFTDPSFELEIFFQNQWLEVLGCGVIHQQILKNCGYHNRIGWAFGLGLERLAMILFEIPDIRLFWSTDPRFLGQFSSGNIIKFKSYSKHEICTKDISFWVSPNFHENSLFDIIRDVSSELVEGVNLVDTYVHPKTGRKSLCYRINYRSMDRTLTNMEVDNLQATVRDRVSRELEVVVR